MSTAPQGVPPKSGVPVWLILAIALPLGLLLLCVVGSMLSFVFLDTLVGRSEPDRHAQCSSNLKQIGLALQRYHDDYKCFPPTYVPDLYRQPAHSWRVLLLPYLGQEELYKQYKFDEPCDGPNNRKLADSIPAVYRCPSSPTVGNLTSYVAVVAPETAWPVAHSRKLEEITDGASQTILVVETTNPHFHWMKPNDMTVEEAVQKINTNPLRRVACISSGHPDGANVLMADGSVRSLNKDTTPEELGALLTTSGGEPSKPLESQ